MGTRGGWLRTYKPRGLESLFKRIIQRISGGPNRGRWWSVTASGHGYGNGSFEPNRVALLADLARPSDVAWDIGAHRGYVTLALAQKVGCVVALEPSALNFWYLAWHARVNKCRNVIPIRSAVSDFQGEAKFGGEASQTYTLAGGSEIVPVSTVAALIQEQKLPAPSYVKIDAEGAELSILQGMGAYLNNPDLLLFVGTHSSELHQECLNFVHHHGLRTVQPRRLDDASAGVWEWEQEFLAHGTGREIPQDLIERIRSM